MARAFIPFPDPRLRRRADEIVEVDDRIRALWDEMLDIMYRMPGLGLAAPQIGVGLRVAVVDCSTSHDQPVRLANPVIVSTSELTRKGPEASPNLPGFVEEVVRPLRTEVRYLDDTGAEVTREFANIWSTSVNHQIDHLNGKMFFDRLPAMRRQRLLQRARKETRKKARGRA